MTNFAAGEFPDSKRHYPILDGLRGVAALLVVAFHLFETHSTSHFDQIINHGYLAVDFFFVLSGFVIGYAYDDRWRTMTTGGFFKRRLIRLHPMIIISMIIGAIAFFFQDSIVFKLQHDASILQVILVMLVGMTLMPIGPAMDIRGWQEMYPLNGPAWSLFYEYVANILYALVVRRFSKSALGVLVFVAGAALIHFAVTMPQGDVIGGWSLESEQLRVGITRLMYPFFAGLLLSRVVKVGSIKHAFLLCSMLVFIVLAMPRVGGPANTWANGLYDSLCIIFLFPLIVYLGASGSVSEGPGARVCQWLGGISYPLYIIHYPFIYSYTAWVANHHPSLGDAFPVMLLTFITCVGLSYLILRYYDIPLRRWLSERYMTR